MKKFNKKKILFISSNFFELRSSINKEFENIGFDVTYVANKPVYFGSLFNKLFKNYMDIFYKVYYYIKLFNKKKFDYIFIINGEFIPYNQCYSLLNSNPNSKSILYCWDAFSSTKNSKKIYKLFDNSYSFSHVDCLNYNLKYKPLFYIYKESANYRKEYDYSIIASYSEDRYNILRKIKQKLKQNGLKFYFHLYIKEVGIYRESKRLNHALDSDICKPTKLPNKKVSEIISKSKCVIDLIDPTHQGQSLRVFECIANDVKILTTNTSIRNEVFYDDQMIEILYYEFFIDKKWLEYEGVYKDKRQYHISNWVKSFFE